MEFQVRFRFAVNADFVNEHSTVFPLSSTIPAPTPHPQSKGAASPLEEDHSYAARAAMRLSSKKYIRGWRSI